MDLTSLTRIQEQAVRHRGSPLIVLAGPGTGKTRTLTYRIAHLISTGIARADQILAVTFTNKAAEEMRSRIDGLGRERDRSSVPWISTFHGFCFRFLQENLSHPFQLLSEQEALNELRKTVRERCPDFPASSLNELGRRISWAKNNLIFSDPNVSLPQWDIYPNWSFCYQAYQEKLKSGGLLDFDELLIQTILVLEENPDRRTVLQLRFPFIFVDEFQDINPCQYRLFQLLAKNNGEWMVIGDPNQAIYGFRGAKAHYFSDLERECPNLTKLTLGETFRLNRTVLAAATQVLKGGIERHPVSLFSRLNGDPFLKVVGLTSDEEEAEYIARFIEEDMGGLSLSSQKMETHSKFRGNRPHSFADYAVLYRLHAQGDLLAKALTNKGIPFKKIQKVHWVEQPEVRDRLALLRAMPSLEISPMEALEKCLRTLNPQRYPVSDKGVEAVKRLQHLATTFHGPLKEFLELLSIQTGLDTYEPDQETVKLLTLHAAKGLEFAEVFITGCEENLLPLSLLRESDPDEERRLFYVGLTRAKEKVMLTWAKKRTLFGRKMVQSPSPFLDDIKAPLKESIDIPATKHSSKPKKKQLSLF
jgi:DNA helicase II / ATP-dependent DNA helicase PcrA